MTLALLIRHAENDARKTRLVGRLPGIHLNPKGLKQAEELAKVLSSAPIQAIFSSPLERATETAQPLADILELSVQVVPDLIEMDYGEWQGRTYKQLKRSGMWRSIGKNPSQIRFPGGESFLEAQQRAVSALEKLSQNMEMIAIFSHADIILLTLAYYLNMPLDDFHRLEIQPASLSVLELKDGHSKVIHINQVRELDFHIQKPKE